MSVYFIALDVHAAFTEIAVVTGNGKKVRRERCDTSIPHLVTIIKQVRSPRRVTFEEGPLASWLARNLKPHCEELLVCDPRRNHLVANDGDKDDPIDAEKLAMLFRGGYLKAVHQPDTLERAVLKQHVGFYHRRVRERVRHGHQLVAELKRHGVFTKVARLRDEEERMRIFKSLPQHSVLLRDIHWLQQTYELSLKQEEEIRKDLICIARSEPVVQRFANVPGVAWIRGLTFFAYIDTPERFRSKTALWKYCGIGLERRRSGTSRTKVKLAKNANRALKNVLLGAAMSAATQQDCPFADKYHYWMEAGNHPAIARRNTARCLAATLWSLWKTGCDYDPARVRGVGIG